MRRIVKRDLSTVTSFGIGGTPEGMIEIASESDALYLAATAGNAGSKVVALGSGSNVLAADSLVPLIVLLVRSKGIEIFRSPDSPTRVRLRVAAGELLDEIVELSVDNGFHGMECLSGIPGTVGAAPLQNVGAYGQDVSGSIISVTVIRMSTARIEEIPAHALKFGYRQSALQKARDLVVLWVTFELGIGADTSMSNLHPDIAQVLGVEPKRVASIKDVRNAVLSVRSQRGTLLDKDDLNSRSAGSFFLNPEIPLSTLPAGAPSSRGDSAGSARVSAAWLIEHSGIQRGFSLDDSGAAVSQKRTLSLVNRGHATAVDVLRLARFVHDEVLRKFGISLTPEVVFLGLQW